MKRKGLSLRLTAGLLAPAIVLSAGCTSIVRSMTGRMADSLAQAILNQNDPETVRQGAPAYLLMIDGFITDAPDDPAVLMTGARLYSSYASAFVDDPERSARLALKARNYGRRALCASVPTTCTMWEAPFESFESTVEALDRKHIEATYVAAMSWATWIQANREDWAAVADKARVEAMMLRVVTLDEHFERGSAHLYLGVLATLLPKAMGGQPEEGRRHFERSIEISGGTDLMAKVLLARDYARLVFDRPLHDRLCTEVLQADPDIPGLTLSNTLARQEAEKLLADSDDYFGE